MERILLLVLVIATFGCATPKVASAPAWDCNGDGKRDFRDTEWFSDNLNKKPDGPFATSCDYNRDGAIGLDDMAEHMERAEH